jgi:hypothetical protein
VDERQSEVRLGEDGGGIRKRKRPTAFTYRQPRHGRSYSTSRCAPLLPMLPLMVMLTKSLGENESPFQLT